MLGWLRFWQRKQPAGFVKYSKAELDQLFADAAAEDLRRADEIDMNRRIRKLIESIGASRD